MDKKTELTVGALVFNYQGRLLIFSSPKWHNKYIVPCGRVEFGERLEDAVRREVREETSLEIFDIKFHEVLEFIGSEEYHDSNRHFVGLQYTCRTAGDEVTLNEEGTEYKWLLPRKALEEDLETSTRQSIEHYLSKLSLQFPS